MATSDERDELAKVVHLSSRRVDEPDSGEVVDAELVEDNYETQQREAAHRRRAAYRRDVVVAGRAVRFVVTHGRTKRAARAVARHLGYVLGGALLLLTRLWQSKTSGRYERIMRAAEIAGNFERLGEWESRSEGFKARRHTRAMNWLDAPLKLVKALVLGLMGVAGVLLALGVVLAVASSDASLVLGPIVGLLDLIRWVSWFVSAFGALLLVAVTAGVVAVFWRVGRGADVAPRWTMPTQAAYTNGGDPITPSIVVKALRDLGIPALRNAIKDMGDAGAGMLGPIKIAGCGVEVDVLLPSGVNTGQIQDKRRPLAENLGRHEHEVFVTIPPAARTVRLWIADSGALDEPIGPSPLVLDPDMTADLYTGRAPWGQDLRGDTVAISLLQRHLLITGLSNQGKTAALRALVLWLALDPTTEFQIADLKGVGDWAMFDGLATVLIQGPTDDDVIAATEMLEEGVHEMERRIALLKASGATDGVTRDMARKPGSGFHPLFLIVDEAQVAFMCPAKGADGRPYGGTKATSRFFMAVRKIHNQGRAVNVHAWEGTQDPTNENLPKLVREGAHIRAALVLGTEEQARMALGAKAVDGGAAPHKLRQGLDKGTLVVAGDGVSLPPGQPSITVRTHFVDGAAAAEVADMAQTRRGGRTAIGPAKQSERDLLADVAEVLGGDTAVKATDVCARLRKLAPGHRPTPG
jgi:DNA segregation ATPase FtsK/SpoIIIE, S-DNA-T family